MRNFGLTQYFTLLAIVSAAVASAPARAQGTLSVLPNPSASPKADEDTDDSNRTETETQTETETDSETATETETDLAPTPTPKPKQTAAPAAPKSRSVALPKFAPPKLPAPAPKPLVTVTPSQERSNDDEAVSELLDARKKAQVQLDGINALNPFSEKAFDPTALPASLNWLDPILKSPTLKKQGIGLARLFQNSVFQQNAQAIFSKRTIGFWVSYAFAVFLFCALYYYIKFRVLASTDRFLIRIVLKSSMFIGFFVMQGLIAVAFFGQPLASVLMAIARVL